MTKYLIAWLALVGASFGATACNGGFSEEEATDICDRLKADLVSCVDDAARLSCIACHEECGRDCQLVQSRCPHDFVCAD